VADVEGDDNLVGYAILVPQINRSFSFKLNPLTSSFMAEAFAIDKALELMDLFT